MQKTTRRFALLAAAALALPAGAAAQQTQPAPAQPAPPAAAPAQDEATQIQQRLGALQERALQDPAVRAEQQAFEAYLVQAMDRLDPNAAAQRARADALKAEVEAARTAGDNAKLNTLAVEAQGLQQFFAGLNQRVMAQAGVQEKRQAFVARLFAKMTELDPQVQTLVDRLTAIRSGGAAPAAPARPASGSR